MQPRGVNSITHLDGQRVRVSEHAQHRAICPNHLRICQCITSWLLRAVGGRQWLAASAGVCRPGDSTCGVVWAAGA